MIYERGDTYSHWATMRDKDDQKIDPSTVSMSIEAPNGSTVLSYSAMTKDSTGVYYYDHVLSSTASYGRYVVRIKSGGGGYHSIERDEFFIMPWRLEDSIRRKTGISKNDISDDDLSHVAWTSYQEALRDVYLHHYKEVPKNNPDTGTGFDGSNTSFQTRYFPIADIGGDGVIGDSDDDEEDITCWWINNAGHRNSGYVNVTEADNGEITICQSDGSTAIPSNNEGVYLDYWSEYQSYNTFLFREAVSFLASHYVNLRFTERDMTTIADLGRPVILKYPNRFLREYRRIINSVRKPKIAGVK